MAEMSKYGVFNDNVRCMRNRNVYLLHYRLASFHVMILYLAKRLHDIFGALGVILDYFDNLLEPGTR